MQQHSPPFSSRKTFPDDEKRAGDKNGGGGGINQNMPSAGAGRERNGKRKGTIDIIISATNFALPRRKQRKGSRKGEPREEDRERAISRIFSTNNSMSCFSPVNNSSASANRNPAFPNPPENLK